MTTSLFLDPNTWDLTVDANRNIALCNEPYSLAQDVACALRTYRGELWYDTTQGLPYLEQILGYMPSATFLKTQFVSAALTVPGILTARAFLTSFVNRTLGGQVQLTTRGDEVITVTTGRVQGNAPWYVQAVG